MYSFILHKFEILAYILILYSVVFVDMILCS